MVMHMHARAPGGCCRPSYINFHIKCRETATSRACREGPSIGAASASDGCALQLVVCLLRYHSCYMHALQAQSAVASAVSRQQRCHGEAATVSRPPRVRPLQQSQLMWTALKSLLRQEARRTCRSHGRQGAQGHRLLSTTQLRRS